ncbi:hypothetical protein ETD83_05465 [Actinomadura soli]|uniref:Uncharacterized protein n=1 Tax=Actinomadura soli TaxID=2508997 RepID=A0A5C4JIK2_9ACTN|nr:hypothetical protein [Actinomadura soli]TMR05689.1 hypothetical protein ETD83_05465 [Actinomadura soli]
MPPDATLATLSNSLTDAATALYLFAALAFTAISAYRRTTAPEPAAAEPAQVRERVLVGVGARTADGAQPWSEGVEPQDGALDQHAAPRGYFLLATGYSRPCRSITTPRPKYRGRRLHRGDGAPQLWHPNWLNREGGHVWRPVAFPPGCRGG